MDFEGFKTIHNLPTGDFRERENKTKEEIIHEALRRYHTDAEFHEKIYRSLMLALPNFLAENVDIPTLLQESLILASSISLLLDELKGIWVVYDYDTKAYPIVLFKKEIEAHRYREVLGYGYVRFLEFGTEWGNF